MAGRQTAKTRGFNCGDYIHASGGEPNRVENIKSKIPMQRGGTAKEVANAIVWLLSEQAFYVTGSFIDVAGGN